MDMRWPVRTYMEGVFTTEFVSNITQKVASTYELDEYDMTPEIPLVFIFLLFYFYGVQIYM